MQSWSYNSVQYISLSSFPAKCIGFVYLLEAPNGQKYIGKKQLFHKKNKKKVESDWLTYLGSSKSFLALTNQFGPSSIKRTILHLCFSLSELTYFETFEIMNRHALLDETYSNDWLMARVRASNLTKLRP